MTWRIRAALWCLVAASTGCGSPASPRAVVLVTIDTLRADHLGCYGYPRRTSPFIDRLGREGVLFENAFTAVSQTSPAHASIMTGLYMAQHRVVRNGMGLAPLARGGGRSLADHFNLAGYDTAAFTAVGFLRGVTSGFKTADVGTGWRDYRQADATVEAALEWLRGKRATDRFFLWIHLFDPHMPQRAPDEDMRAMAFPSAAAEDAFIRTITRKHGIPTGFFQSRAALVKRYVEYDAEIRFADRQLERLHQGMEAAGQNVGTLWIVTADHGEALGSHALDGHGEHIYEEQLRVPLIFWAPGRTARGRVSDLVRHVDLLPTLAQLYGWDLKQAPFTLPGRSFAPSLEDPARKLPRTLAFAQRRPPDNDWEPGDVFSLFDRDWKYIVHTKGQDEFFDLRNDPLELTNLAASTSPLKDKLAQSARDMFAGLSREGTNVGSTPVDPAQHEELRALGYVN
jgi:choline-sulfatase